MVTGIVGHQLEYIESRLYGMAVGGGGNNAIPLESLEELGSRAMKIYKKKRRNSLSIVNNLLKKGE